MVGETDRFSIAMDGAWDLSDLSDLVDGVKDSYAYFYVLSRYRQSDNSRLEQLVADSFWNGSIPEWHLREILYREIPQEHSLRIIRIHYASPGFIELGAYVGVFIAMAKCVQMWATAIGNVFETYDKVESFFKRRRDLRKPPAEIELNSQLATTLDEARAMMFELGTALGYPNHETEKILSMLQNPIAGLKFMIAIARETRKLHDLSERGLIRLPQIRDMNSNAD